MRCESNSLRYRVLARTDCTAVRLCVLQQTRCRIPIIYSISRSNKMKHIFRTTLVYLLLSHTARVANSVPTTRCAECPRCGWSTSAASQYRQYPISGIFPPFSQQYKTAGTAATNNIGWYVLVPARHTLNNSFPIAISLFNSVKRRRKNVFANGICGKWGDSIRAVFDI